MSEEVTTAEPAPGTPEASPPSDVTLADVATPPVEQTPPAAPAAATPPPVATPDPEPAPPPVAEPEPEAVEPKKEEAEEDPLLGDDEKPEESEKDPDAHWAVGIVPPDQEEYFSRFKTPGDLAKSYNELRKHQSNLIKMPDDLASDEDMGKFYDRIGRPKSPEDYKLPRDFVEGIEESGLDRFKGFLNGMHEAGARNETVQAAVKWFSEEAAAIEAETHAAAEAAHTERLDALKLEWPGIAYTTNVKGAIDALKAWNAPDDAKELSELTLEDGTKLGKHPTFIKGWHNVRIGMSDAASPVADSGGTTGSYSEDEINGMLEKAYETNDHKLRKRAEDAMRANLERKGENFQIGPGSQRAGVR